jgi:hypothetical protein
MKVTCPCCNTHCEYMLAQKMASKNCDLKIHFNIVEVKCLTCGSKCMVSTKPKKINVFSATKKIAEY